MKPLNQKTRATQLFAAIAISLVFCLTATATAGDCDNIDYWGIILIKELPVQIKADHASDGGVKRFWMWVKQITMKTGAFVCFDESAGWIPAKEDRCFTCDMAEKYLSYDENY